MLGYLALIGSHNRAIRSLGLIAVVGEISCLLAAMVVLPALWLSSYPSRKSAEPRTPVDDIPTTQNCLDRRGLLPLPTDCQVSRQVLFLSPPAVALAIALFAPWLWSCSRPMPAGMASPSHDSWTRHEDKEGSGPRLRSTVPVLPPPEASRWHVLRHRAILLERPEVAHLTGFDCRSAYWVAALVCAQLGIAVGLRHSPGWVLFATAFLAGAPLAHALGVLIHECSHNLVFRSTSGNKALALVANLPLGAPAASSSAISTSSTIATWATRGSRTAAIVRRPPAKRFSRRAPRAGEDPVLHLRTVRLRRARRESNEDHAWLSPTGTTSTSPRVWRSSSSSDGARSPSSSCLRSWPSGRTRLVRDGSRSTSRSGPVSRPPPTTDRQSHQLRCRLSRRAPRLPPRSLDAVATPARPRIAALRGPGDGALLEGLFVRPLLRPEAKRRTIRRTIGRLHPRRTRRLQFAFPRMTTREEAIWISSGRERNVSRLEGIEAAALTGRYERRC